MELIRIEDLNFTYPECAEPALSEVSFSIEKGEFILICGNTGSGKSTLLDLIKPELAPHGTLSGNILYKGRSVYDMTNSESASSIGFLMQNPDMQAVTDKVSHELAFGLENLRLPSPAISRRVAEIAGYFGIESWYDKKVSELSGGQKQILNLASVMVMDPEVLVLDEPTAQLDPVAAREFIENIRRLNKDFGITVIMAEHRPEEPVTLCDRLLVMDKGRIVSFASPKEAIAKISSDEDMPLYLPAAARVWHSLRDITGDVPCPLSPREGRDYIRDNFNTDTEIPAPSASLHEEKPALEFKNIYFKYDKDSDDVLSDLSFKAYPGEIYCICGGNGSGKTTALSLASGINRPYSGRIKIFGRNIKEYKSGELYGSLLSALPQDVQTVFYRKTVREELKEAGWQGEELPFDLRALLDKHPYDLSGGEMQLLAICKVILQKPRLMLLDEPTKGLDGEKKKALSETLKNFIRLPGHCVVMVSHDLEFACETADRCAMFFRGRIVSDDSPYVFFQNNKFYTTAAAAMSSGFLNYTVTCEDLSKALREGGLLRK